MNEAQQRSRMINSLANIPKIERAADNPQQKKEMRSKTLIIADDDKIKEGFIDCFKALQITVELKTREQIEKQIKIDNQRKSKRLGKTERKVPQVIKQAQVGERAQSPFPLFISLQQLPQTGSSSFSDDEYHHFHRQNFIDQLSSFRSNLKTLRIELPSSHQQSSQYDPISPLI